MSSPNEEFVFAPLGGVGEIGMNLALYGIGSERSKRWLIVDFGVAFAGDDLPGVDLIMPDIAYPIEERRLLKGFSTEWLSGAGLRAHIFGIRAVMSILGGLAALVR